MRPSDDLAPGDAIPSDQPSQVNYVVTGNALTVHVPVDGVDQPLRFVRVDPS